MGSKVLVSFFILTSAAAIGGVVIATKDGSAASGAPLNLDKAKAPDIESDVEPGPETAIPLAVIARLPTENGDRYVKVNFELRVVKAEDRDKVLAYMPRMRDTMITYFLDRNLDEVGGSAGLERTKQDILKRLQRIVPQPLRALYITDFVVAM